ncbi:MAG: hypothetical protein WDZ50_01010 [Woeseia sp.]
MKTTNELTLLPRLLRFRDAPRYLGMDRNRFNLVVRPHLTNIPIGRQGIAFDRLELDAWVDDYKSRNGRRLKASKPEDDVCQRSKAACRDFAKGTASGISKSAADMHRKDGSTKAREHLRGLRQSES